MIKKPKKIVQFIEEKDKMVQQLERLEIMDKIVPLNTQQVMDHNKQLARVMSQQYEKQIAEWQSKKQSDMIEFKPEDFRHFQQQQELQKKQTVMDIITAKKSESLKQVFPDDLKPKWDRVRRKLRMIGRIKKLYDEVKLYGTSCRVETSIKRQQVITEIERILTRNSTFIDKSKSKSKLNYLLPYRLKKIYVYIYFFLLIYTAFCTPIKITFIDNTSIGWTVIDSIIDFFFYFDILINLNSPFLNSETNLLITNRKVIIWNYCKNWLLLDILSVFPFDLIEPTLVLLKMIRVINVMKKIKNNSSLLDIFDFIQLNSTITRAIKFFFTVSVCVHIMGCLWYYIAKMKNFDESTWVYELDFQDESNQFLYLTSIYWAVTTIATVGFGDVHAQNEYEQLVSIFWMIFGAGFFSFTIGSLSTLLAQLDTRQSHLDMNITFMDEFCEETKLPKQMKDKIRKALQYNSYINIFSHSDIDQFLLDIPINLRYQISESMYQGLRSKIQFLNSKDQVFISIIIPKLQPMKVSAGEYIYLKGEYPNHVYFIANGRVNMVFGVHNLTFKTYTSGSYFGEIEIFDSSSRLHSARAEVDTDLFSMEQNTFKRILKQFPDYLEEVQNISIKKLRKENESIQKLQSLLGISATSTFFRKKRKQSLYTSVQMRLPILMVPIQESLQEQEVTIIKQKSQISIESTHNSTPVQDAYDKLMTNLGKQGFLINELTSKIEKILEKIEKQKNGKIEKYYNNRLIQFKKIH